MHNTILVDLPIKIKGFLISNPDNTYTIILNSRLSYETNLESYLHELIHITQNDFEKEDIQIIEANAHEEA